MLSIVRNENEKKEYGIVWMVYVVPSLIIDESIP